MTAMAPDHNYETVSDDETYRSPGLVALDGRGSWYAEFREDVARYTAHHEGHMLKALLLEQGAWALLHYRIASAIYRRYNGKPAFPLLALLIASQKLVEIVTGFYLPFQADLAPGLYLAHFGPTLIHPEVSVGPGCNLSQGVNIGVSGRGARRGVPKIGARVYIGINAVVVGSITVGDDAVIGANSTVTRDVPSGCTVVGNPATVVSNRSTAGMGLHQRPAPVGRRSRLRLVPARAEIGPARPAPPVRADLPVQAELAAAPAESGPRPARAVLAEPAATDRRMRFVWRTPLAVLTILCAALHAPSAVTSLAVLAGFILIGTLLIRSGGGSLADRVLVVTGGVLAVSVLIGLLLAVAPAGLAARSWVLAFALVELAVVFMTLPTDLPRPLLSLRGVRAPAGTAWYLAGALVIAAGITAATLESARADAAPAALSVRSQTGGEIVVTVAPGHSNGDFVLTETAGESQDTFNLDLAGGQASTVTLAPAPAGPVDVTLSKAGSSSVTPLAQLELRAS